MNSLTDLLSGIVPDISSVVNVHVSDISMDSRNVKSGSLFISLSKSEEQRFQYLLQAINAGASVILLDEQQTLSIDENLVIEKFKVNAYFIKGLADLSGEIASRFHGQPSQALTVIAITGTNGKTSVSQFIAQALESLGLPCGVIGTLGVGRIDNLSSTGMTTPDPVSLQAVLASFCNQNIKYAVIEASSHALEQGRLNSVAVDVAVLTNLSRDHLDYHQSMSNYALAKQRLFEFSSLKTAIINGNDEFGRTLINVISANINLLTYSCNSNSEVQENNALNAVDVETSMEGLHFLVEGELGRAKVNSKLLGHFNVDNLLATLASLLAVGIEFKQAVKAIESCHFVNGRMESRGGLQQPRIVIDFAHTPDALKQALRALRPHVLADGHLWCVFGCGGDRDKGKRPLMAASVEDNADQIVVTDDNPRSESNVAIVKDVLAGFKFSEQVHVEHDRQLAINYAVTHATKQDVVLVAGKGHEQYQEILGVKHPFSDSDAVNLALQAANDEHHSYVGIS